MSAKMNPGSKRIKQALLSYVITMGVTAITSFSIMLLLKPHGCNAMGQALVLLWER